MATTTEDLKWKATVNPKNSWIELEYPSGVKSKESITGVGSQNISITVEKGNPGESDTAGTVTFECLDCNPKKDPITVNVTRCVETECTEWNYTYEDVEVDCHPHTSVNVNYTGVCKTDASTTTAGTSAYTINIECYDGDTDKIVQETPFKITQKAGDCVCHECNCGSLTVSPTSLTWSYDEGDADTSNKEVEYTITDSCEGKISNVKAEITDGIDYFKVISYNNGKIIIRPTGTNPGTGGDKTGTVSVSYEVEGVTDTCTSSITLTQIDEECTCNSFIIDESPLTITVGKEKEITFNKNCVKKEDIRVVSSNNDKVTVSMSSTEDKIIINGIKSTDDEEEITVTISYKAGTHNDCSKQIKVSVKCPEITISCEPESLDCDGGNATFSVNTTSN